MDGQDAVEKVQQLGPDVVVMDFSMPVLNGVEAAREILKSRPNTRIVLCSMYLDTQLASIADDLRVKSLLSKSNVGRIVEGIEAALRGESFSEFHA